MPPGFPPVSAYPPAPEGAVGPSEVLSLGTTGLIALPQVGAALTFLPPGADAEPGVWCRAWESWVAGCFAPVLAPALVEMSALAGRERVRELRAADLALRGRLSPEALPRLGEAGRRLLADLRGARSARWLERFRGLAAAGEPIAPLFPTVFAARAALFHLPPRPMLSGYARMEWEAASGSGTDAPTDALGALPESLWRPAIVAVAA